MVGKPEIYEISEKAYPPFMKLAIQWGGSYQEMYPIYHYIHQLIKKYYLPKDVGIELLMRLTNMAIYWGMVTFEEVTRNNPNRYSALSLISGVKVSELKTKTPIPEKPEHSFHLEDFLLADPSLIKSKEFIENQIKLLRQDVKLYKITTADGKEYILSEPIYRVLKLIIKLREEEYELAELEDPRNWNTRKKRMAELMDSLTVSMYKHITEDGMMIAEETLNDVLDKIHKLKKKEEDLKKRKKLYERGKKLTKKKIKRKALSKKYRNIKKKGVE